MALPDDFLDELLYAPRSTCVHELVSIDAEAGRVVARMHTTSLGPLVEDQVVRPQHPRHVPGAYMVQATGTLGLLHAVYVLGLRPTEGWAGFGTHMDRVRFRSLGVIGPDLTLEATAERVRWLRGTCFVDYAFRYTQEERVVFTSTQKAAWTQRAGEGTP